jgi:hypothetical protein
LGNVFIRKIEKDSLPQRLTVPLTQSMLLNTFVRENQIETDIAQREAMDQGKDPHPGSQVGFRLYFFARQG